MDLHDGRRLAAKKKILAFGRRGKNFFFCPRCDVLGGRLGQAPFRERRECSDGADLEAFIA